MKTLISLKLEPEFLVEIDEFAMSLGITRTALIEEALRLKLGLSRDINPRANEKKQRRPEK